MALIAFEYNREQNSLHNNYFKNANELEYDLNSNGYRPLAFVDHDVTLDEEWERLCKYIYRNRPDYQTAVFMTMATIQRITLNANK